MSSGRSALLALGRAAGFAGSSVGSSTSLAATACAGSQLLTTRQGPKFGPMSRLISLIFADF